MADTALPDPSELIAARAVIEPQLRGLAILLCPASGSSALHDRLASVNAARHHRDDLLVVALAARDAYIAALDALANDGYPELPGVQLEISLLAEVRSEESDIEAAVAIFEAEMAAAITVNLGAPVPKT